MWYDYEVYTVYVGARVYIHFWTRLDTSIIQWRSSPYWVIHHHLQQRHHHPYYSIVIITSRNNVLLMDTLVEDKNNSAACNRIQRPKPKRQIYHQHANTDHFGNLWYIIDDPASLFFLPRKKFWGMFIVVQEHLFLRLQEIIIIKFSWTAVFYLKFFEYVSIGQVTWEIYPFEWKVYSSEISITNMYCWYMFLMAVLPLEFVWLQFMWVWCECQYSVI